MDVLNFIKEGEIVPWGLSKYVDGYRLKLPVWAMYGKHYDARSDDFVTGWAIYGFCFRFGIRFGIQSIPKTDQRCQTI